MYNVIEGGSVSVCANLTGQIEQNVLVSVTTQAETAQSTSIHCYTVLSNVTQ